jgi:hypothetical protein
MAGVARVSKAEMTSLVGGADPKNLRDLMENALNAGLEKRGLQDRAFALGVPVAMLSQADRDQVAQSVKDQAAGFTALKDRSSLASLAQAVTQASTEDGHKKLASAPAHASIMEFPKASHIVNRNPKERLQAMDVAVAEANHLVYRGIRQMQDLHGISPLAWLKRLDSNRNHGEQRREFDATRGAFDGTHVRERAKSDLFTGLMGRDSGPNDHGRVLVNAHDIA